MHEYINTTTDQRAEKFSKKYNLDFSKLVKKVEFEEIRNRVSTVIFLI